MYDLPAGRRGGGGVLQTLLHRGQRGLFVLKIKFLVGMYFNLPLQ